MLDLGNPISMPTLQNVMATYRAIPNMIQPIDETLHNLLNNAPCGFLSFTDQGSIEIINSTLLKILGYELEELVGEKFYSILPLASRIFYETHFLPLLRLHGKADEVYFSLRSKPGNDVPMLINGVRRENAGNFFYDCVFMPIRQRIQYEGEILQAKKIAETAVQEQKLAESALRQAHDQISFHIENTPLATIIWNAQFQVQQWSRQAEKIFGWQAEEVIGKNLLEWQFVFEEDLENVNAEAERIIEDVNTSTCQNRNYRKDGSVIYCEWFHSTLRDELGKVISVLSFAQDITDRKQAEIELEQAKEEAEASTRAKSEFLANMSHEIRTPMNGVLGMAQLLETTDLTDEQQDFVRIISDSGGALLKVIDDILDFSKIESGKFEIELHPFDLTDVVKSVCNLLSSSALDRKILLKYRIQPDIPTTLIGDGSRLRQVLLNLVGNAIKFTAEGEVTVEVRYQKEDAKNNLLFMIRDTGVGIERDRLDRLFQPFMQADASINRKYGGTGLGLAISKHLVELMGGKIWVESLGHRSGDVSTNWPPQDLQTDRKGSTFFFTISLQERAEIKLSSVKTDDQTIFDRQMAEQLPLKILLAEDNIVNQKFASFTLKKLGYQVDIVNNGLEALIAVQTQSYDLILMDIQMPEMDGLSATKQIRQNSSENSIAQPYIVAMTANALPNDQQVCLDVGMDDFISKPIDIQELIRVLAQVGSTQKSKTLSPKP